MIIVSSTRVCSKCGKSKPLSAFHRDRSRPSGYSPACKDCRRINTSIRTPDPIRLCRKCGEQKPATDFHRDRTTSDGLHPYCKLCVLAYHKTIASAKAQNNRRWQQANPDKVRRYTLKWWRQNRDIARQNSRKHWALFYGAEGHYTLAEWQALCDWFGNVCLACGKAGEILHGDHVIPLSKGGANYIENIQPLCGRCNASKGNRRSTDYRDPARLAAFFRVYYDKERTE